MNTEHYFDWAATSPSDEEILKDALETSLRNWGNPSSTHQLGKEAKKALTQAREKAAEVLGVKAETIYFTSGGTESDQIPLLALLNKPSKGSVLISSIEHPAVREEAKALQKCGWKVISIPADENGIITPEAVEKLLTKDTMLVCVMAVNNETGSIQPVYEIADVITKYAQNGRKAKFHVDCVQAAGKIPLNLSYKGIDSAAFSAHKICGPRGIGILYSKEPIDSFLRGGGQENGMRSGTENLFGITAFAKCLEKYFIRSQNSSASQKFEEQKKLTSDFIQKLSKIKGCTLIPPSRLQNQELFSPYVVQAAFNNIPGNVMLRALDAQGFYISTGSACSSKKQSRPILEAMHISSELRETSVRFSFGPLTTPKAMDDLLKAVEEINKTFNG